ncbi:MAG: lactate dehydrogenase [Chloroflexi bacterium]|nr:lactate dehydrogenase [Chloroflexota bacterium]
MPTSKVAFFSPPGSRADYMIEQAPQDIELVIVDPALSDEEKAPLLQDVEAVISMDVSVDLLKQAPNVKLIQTLSAGYDRLDLEAIGELGVPVANNGGANAIAVSEHTIAMMISLSGKLWHQYDITMKQRKWKSGLEGMKILEITDKTVGIVGMGRIGKQVAKRLKGFDTRTLFYDVVDVPDDVQKELNIEPMEFDELLRESDIVTLHVPLTRRTRGMISDRELDMMKPSAFLVNCCRGPVVDERALHRALSQGQIAAAGLDVLEVEPTPEDNPLFDLDNVVITPHMAGPGEESTQRAATFAFYNIGRVLAGETPESLVYPE